MVSQSTVRFVGYIGAAANWLIPITGVMNLRTQDARNIDPKMTTVLAIYSCVFMRWAIAISPANYPLFACHVANSTAQVATLAKYFMYGRGSAKAPKQIA